MRYIRSVIAAFSLQFLMLSAAFAQSIGGGAFIPVQDGSSHSCIDVTQSLVSISLITAQLKRTETFWKKSRSLGVKIDVKLLNQSSEPFDFPRGRQISASSYMGDIGLLPMIFPVMAKYSLINPNDKKAYVNVGLDVFLINIEEASQAAKGVLSFIDFSKNLPLPANPYLQGVQLFGQFAQKIIDADIQSSEDKLPAAALSFDLASSNADVTQCETQHNVAWRYPILREGIVAVMWDYQGKPEDGFVRVSDVDKYCYYPTLSQRISFAAKNNDACPPAAQAKPLNNPLVAFSINKWAAEPRSNKIEHFNVGPLSGALSEPILTYSGAQAATKKTEEKYPLSAGGIKTYFDAINTDRLAEQFKQAPTDVHQQGIAIREVETAIALHRCGLLGVSAKDCL